MQQWLASSSLIRRIADFRAEWKWRRSDRLGPLPSRAKRRLLRQYAREFGLHILVETGSFFGDTVAALRREFDHIYSIELSPQLASRARQRFRTLPNVTIIQGDSGSVLADVIRDMHRPVLFWLDGHFSGGTTARGPLDTPVIAELEVVLSQPALGHVVLIDDAAWLDAELGGNGLEQIRVRILAAYPHWTVERRNDIVRAHAPAATPFP
jgi:hypothetical protein